MKKILVIEDETAINDLICMNLEIAGYEPAAFFDGAEFSRHLKETDDYDLALLDIMLPGKDGFELLEELKALHSENEKLKSKLANSAVGDVMSQAVEVEGVKVLAVRVADVDMNGLRNLGDQLKEKLGEGVVVIASSQDGKVNLMAAVTDGAQKKGAHAGNLIKAIAGLVGGGGGGRPGMAQAGGKNPAGIDQALAKVAEVVRCQVQKQL